METVLYVRPPYIPAELRTQPRWLPWRLSGRKKIPLDSNGRSCDPRDPTNWQRFHDATAPYFREKHGVRGVGFGLNGSGLATLDVDRCVDERGRVSPEAQGLIDQFASYAELSPSGRGLHVVIHAVLPGGNRRLPGVELIGSGFITMTGHPVFPGSIREGGAAWNRLLASLPAKVAPMPSGQIEPILAPSRSAVNGVLARALPNPRFRKLWQGDWSGYATRSEADAALAMHVARNGGDVSVIVELLQASAMPRDPRRDQRYLIRTAVFVLASVDVHVPQWRGVTVPAGNDAERDAVERVQATCARGSDAQLLHRMANEIAERWRRGERPDDGYFRLSPQALSGDFPAQPGSPPPEKIMSRQGCLKVMKRLAAEGVFDLTEGEDCIVWREGTKQRTRTGKVTRVRVEGTTMVSILDGFVQRLTGGHEENTPPTCVCIGNSVS